MIKESNEELNRNVQSPEKLKRMAMKLNLQVMIKQLNDEDLEWKFINLTEMELPSLSTPFPHS